MERLRNWQATLWLAEGWDLDGCGAALKRREKMGRSEAPWEDDIRNSLPLGPL